MELAQPHPRPMGPSSNAHDLYRLSQHWKVYVLLPAPGIAQNGHPLRTVHLPGHAYKLYKRVDGFPCPAKRHGRSLIPIPRVITGTWRVGLDFDLLSRNLRLHDRSTDREGDFQ